MIVKNGAASIARCLESMRGIADRITIGDTGSTDDTLRIARSFGASIVSVPWQDDFAAARNAVLEHATCDWIIFLDADEMLDQAAARQIKSLTTDSSVFGYDVTTWNYVMDAGFRSSGEQARANPVIAPETGGYPAYFPSSNTRLFRRDPLIYFEHCVHETVADRIDELGLHRRRGDFLIHHFGYVEDTTVRRSQKENLYYSLALKKVLGSPESYEAVLGAGIAELDHAKQAATALPYFEKAISLCPYQPGGWVYNGVCLTRLGRYDEALQHIHRATSLDPNHALATSTLGDVYLQTGDHKNSRLAYERAIQLGDASPLTLAKLGAAEVNLGHSESGMARVETALSQSLDNTELYDIYATAAFLAGRPIDACEVANRRLSMKGLSAFNFVLAATLHLHTNMRHKAHGILHDGIRRFPEDPELRNMIASLGVLAS
ncbi:glycosyltransferase involved in cell wall biosynthesis [Granulicella aggregans]|uniref:Glycosyltransferase involved in cell wall biosynthesis n=2 Tax=Granulicella aggregans TaxID=474949 RepID=A0A7W7ZK09_9BACT|nr:TPR domain-containing glycosyltransferase [Granulicella aggregans]MBB5061153.1 glycosyltransferase involved in cell wall biosynthesis [Granulicella aggregans]